MSLSREHRPPARRRRLGLEITLLALVGLVLVPGGCGGSAPPEDLSSTSFLSAHPFVLDPSEPHYGATYAEWSQRWWQWAYELPRAGHPLYDRTGADAFRGQVDPVWFIGGVYTVFGQPVDGTVVRDITIRSGTALFFPLINAVADNSNCLAPDTSLSFSQLRRIVADAVANVRDVHFEIDGLPVVDSPDLKGAVRYRAQAPAFSAILSADNINTDACGGVPLPARVVDPVASDGLWMMIEPLPEGGHTLNFSATFPTTNFHLNVTYNILVTP